MAKVITVLSIFLALVAKNHVTAFQLLSNNVEVSKADIPSDIKGISECRRTAFPPDKPLRRPEKSFINAEAAVRESVICLVAKEQFFPWRILGTADVRIMRKGSKAIVNNVFVRKDARGRGLAKQLMMGVETVVPSTTQSISLDVKTQNLPAISVYRCCGYTCEGVNAVVEGLSGLTGANLQVVMTKEL